MELKRLRIEKGLTRQDVAEYMGVTAGTVKAWELGYRDVNMEKAVALCELLGCTVSDLIGESAPATAAIMFAYLALDETDRAKVAAFIEGLRAAKRPGV